MQAIFERFMSEEEGNALIDWTVLMAGAVMMAVSVFLTMAGHDTQVTDSPQRGIVAEGEVSQG